MSLFRVNREAKSYLFSIFKIAVSVIIISLSIERPWFPFDNSFVSLLFAGVTILCILVITISLGEIMVVSETKALLKLKSRNPKDVVSVAYDLDVIVGLTEECDILNIVIKAEDKIIKVGASSDMDRNHRFFDKMYYVDENETISIGEYKEALLKINGNKNILEVISIDDLPPRSFNIPPIKDSK